MNVKLRIKALCVFYNISVSEFEKSIDASNGYVNSISKSIGLEKLNIILENYPNVNIEWLLIGNGPMLKKELATDHKQSEENKQCNKCIEYEERVSELKDNLKTKEQLIKLLNQKVHYLKKLCPEADV